MRGGRRSCALILGATLLAGVGCVHMHKAQMGPDFGGAHVAVPPAGAVPRELDKITLPPYVIEAPDQLLIEVVQRSTVTDKDTGPTRPVTDRLPVQPISGTFMVRLDGTVTLGFWGNVPVAGLTLDQAAEAIRQQVVNNPVLTDFKTKKESIVVILDVTAYNSKR